MGLRQYGPKLWRFWPWRCRLSSQRRTLAVTGAVIADHWQAKAMHNGLPTTFAPGTDWPMAHGSDGNAAAVLAADPAPLIDHLHDARLVWVAEDIFPSGRGGNKVRGDFTFFTHAWRGIGFGGYGAPIIADGKVYVYVMTGDTEAISNDPRSHQDIYQTRPRSTCPWPGI